MKINPKLRLRLLFQNIVFALLVVALAGLLAYLAKEYPQQWDLTQNSRNTLSPSTQETLKKLPGPVTVTAYATPRDPRLGDLRKVIQDFLAPYQRAKPDFTIQFIDPTEQPKLTAAAGVQANGELVIQYGQRSEHLTNLTEQALANLLMRLGRAKESLVMALEGHGERKLAGAANHDLGEFGKQLAAKGFKINSLNLALAQEVPANVNVLVIASPQVNLLPEEVRKILAYVEKGGNLLWLIDPEPLRGLEPLAEKLGLVLSPGTVVDPAAGTFSSQPTMAVAAGYGNHPLTRDFRLNTVYPFARQIGTGEDTGWHAVELIRVASQGWLETGKLEGEIRFDKDRDTPGPITIAVALERAPEGHAQRVVVVGNGSFLSNATLGLLGNMDLGVAIMNWLSGEDDLISIQPRANVDPSLDLSRPKLMAITLGFLVALPLGFFIAGGVIWWRRRKS